MKVAKASPRALIWWRVPGRHRGEIVSSVDVISANVSERALACRAQSGGIQEISAAAVQVDQRTQKNVELFHGTTFPGQHLLRAAQELSAAIACFVLQRAAPVASGARGYRAA
jgi:methyl-accepting chemotaxis protein